MNIEVTKYVCCNEGIIETIEFSCFTSVILTSSTHINKKQSCSHLGLTIKGVVQDMHNVETKDYILMESQTDVGPT